MFDAIFQGFTSLVVGASLAVAGLFGYHAPAPEILDIRQEIQEIQEEISQLEGSLGTAIAAPNPVALFETSLASSITSDALTMTLVSGTDKDGNTLASSTYGMIIDEGTASEELVLANCTDTACTGMVRGVSVVTGTTTVSTLQKAHRRGASVKITNAPQLIFNSNVINGKQAVPTILFYPSGLAACTDNDEICDKEYIDGVAVAGASDANTTTKGIIEIASGIETASSTAAGGGDTTADLVAPTSAHSAQPSTSGYTIPVTRNDGTLDENFISTSSPYTFTGPFAVGESTTTPDETVALSVIGDLNVDATTTASAVIATSTIGLGDATFDIGGLVDGSNGDALITDGAGGLTFSSPNCSVGTAYPVFPGSATSTVKTQVTGATAANIIQFSLPCAISLAKITFFVDKLTTEGTMDLAIYTEDGATQSILSEGNFITSASEAGSFSASNTAATIGPGVFYLAMLADNGLDLEIQGQDLNLAPWAGGSDQLGNISGEPCWMANATVASGSLPSTITPTTCSGTRQLLFRLDN